MSIDVGTSVAVQIPRRTPIPSRALCSLILWTKEEKTFEEAEKAYLAKGWLAARGVTRHAWEEVRDASRDAWNRVRANHKK